VHAGDSSLVCSGRSGALVARVGVPLADAYLEFLGGRCRPNTVRAAATKTGLGGWSEVLRQELQPDVRVMVIEPGAVATELPDHIARTQTRPEIDQFYQQLAIPAEEIAAIISFCVSRPRAVSVNEVLVRPAAQALWTSMPPPR